MAWNRFNKAPSRKPPPKSWSIEEMKMIGFVISKGVNIGISPDWKNTGTRWLIDIKINKNTYTDPNTYEDETVLNKIYEYYKYYYDKYRN